MRKLALALTVAAASAWAGAPPDRAQATVLNSPEGLRAAIDTMDVTEQVHCRPGWWHHRRSPRDGCYRYRPRVYYYPAPYYRYYYGGPYYPYYGGPYYRRYGYWGPRRYWGGPTFYFGFGF